MLKAMAMSEASAKPGTQGFSTLRAHLPGLLLLRILLFGKTDWASGVRVCGVGSVLRAPSTVDPRTGVGPTSLARMLGRLGACRPCFSGLDPWRRKVVLQLASCLFSHVSRIIHVCDLLRSIVARLLYTDRNRWLTELSRRTTKRSASWPRA